ncbi:radical SAM protein [Persephonella sp.]
MQYLFGPVNSRRFGLSLGIDLSPAEKSCSFDCLYCEVGKGKTVNRIKNEPKPEEIIIELKEFIEKHGYPDVITITANGEPTLHSKLEELIDSINRIKGGSKTLILSNGSTINRPDIQRSLGKLDMVKISVDAVDEKAFKKVNRPLENIRLKDILDGLTEFRKNYQGELIVELLFVRNVNDSEENIVKTAQFLKKLKPDRVDIGTVDRPPAYRVKPLTDTELFSIAEFFDGLNVNVVTRGMDGKEGRIELSDSQIIKTLERRPFTVEDLKAVFTENTCIRVKEMVEKGILKEKKVNNRTFITV